MRVVFADALYWIAMANPADPWRAAALEATHALGAARLDSQSEQELLLVQGKLTDRSANLAPLLAKDPRLKYNDTNKYRVVPELVPMREELVVASVAT